MVKTIGMVLNSLQNLFFQCFQVFTVKLLSSGSFSSVEHSVSCLLPREAVQQLGLKQSGGLKGEMTRVQTDLFIPIWLLGGDIDDTDVQEVDQGGQHHQGEGESEGSSSFTGPLSFHPGETINYSINQSINNSIRQ